MAGVCAIIWIGSNGTCGGDVEADEALKIRKCIMGTSSRREVILATAEVEYGHSLVEFASP